MKNNKIRRRIAKKPFSMPNPKKYLVIPLSFGKGLKLSIVEVKRKFFAKPWQYAAMSMISILLVSSSMFVYKNYFAKGATYGWLQTDWSGGASATTATHTNNQENWTYYSSKTDNLSTADGVITQASASPATWTETADADFSDNGTYTNTYNSGGSVRSKKPNGLACTTAGECLGGFCLSNYCRSTWNAGPCSGIDVYYMDTTGGVWKTVRSDCNTPQCAIDGAQNGDYLVASNTVDFSLYPARNFCKNLGGRLPTIGELSCISTNRVSYGNNFLPSTYWSSTEYSSTYAWYVNFSNGYTLSFDKDNFGFVRCVRDQ